MTDLTPFPIPDEVVARARSIARRLQPYIEDLVVRELLTTYRQGWGDGYLARPANLDAESPTAEGS